MMTQGVMTQAARLFGNASGGVASKGKQTGNGFELIIDNNIMTAQKTNESKTITQNEIQKSDVTERNADRTKAAKASKGSTDKDAQETGSVANKDVSKVSETSKDKQAEMTEKVTAAAAKETNVEGKEELEIDEELIAKINGMLQAIRESVMNMLKLTPEELDGLLADQGMGITDLLQPENLQKLVLANGGTADILSVLTDESLEHEMKELLSEVESLKAEAGLSLTPDQMKRILEQVNLQAKEQSGFQAGQYMAKDQASVMVTEAVGNPSEDEEITAKTANDGQRVTVQNDNEETFSGITKLSAGSEDNTGAQTYGDSDNHDELKFMDPFQMFVENLTKISTDTKADFNGSLSQVTEIRDIANQIIERIKVSIAPDQTAMELHLNPEHLGKVNLTVQSKNGMMTAQFVVQNEISKEAIESQLHTLRETLNQQGIKVEAIEVTVSAYTFEQNMGEGNGNQEGTQKKNTGRQISLEEAMNMTEGPEEEFSDITGIRGSQIDYTA